MSYNNEDYRRQKHVHEIQGSVEIAEPREEPHNHRFATVSGEAIPYGAGDHYHEVAFRTDFYEDHYHEFCGRTSGAICVGGGRHVHFLESVTTVNDCHRHKFRVATLIENPIGKNC
ncbi:YmaF family protein [Anaerocolumna sp. AGMB13020]|uniref:YmaF family protein n=1 Tax=Anaerocolumna sp. AGMB13020 TaxID=3081750 RepID=UPI002952B8C3|nr:YmaF family protein [Anaerocolumna sp. AGMB13020]WOO37554.1 YmaF family protein [Anaerocolumna sp. AGMB13020]